MSESKECGQLNEREPAKLETVSRRLSSSLDGDVRCPKRAKLGDDSSSPIEIKVGSRKSKLALIQTDLVIEELGKVYKDDYKFEIIQMSTIGDHILDTPLAQIGSKSLFTKELEEALLNKSIHFVVHSLKDLPTTLPANLCIAAILSREDPNDALVLKPSLSIDDPLKLITEEVNEDKVPKKEKKKVELDGNEKSAINGSSNEPAKSKTVTVGTSSLRRIAQLRALNPNINAIDVRGNLNTRFNKLDNLDGPYDALILAAAGLRRSGFSSRISCVLKDNWWYAVGQGSLAVECRQDDAETMALLSPLIDYRSTYECICERAFMKRLEGGCSVPLGVRCFWEPTLPTNSDLTGKGDEPIFLSLSGAVFSLDGSKLVKYTKRCNIFEKSTSSERDDANDDFGLFTNICLPPANIACYQLVKQAFTNCAKLGADLAEHLKTMGASEILSKIRP